MCRVLPSTVADVEQVRPALLFPYMRHHFAETALVATQFHDLRPVETAIVADCQFANWAFRESDEALPAWTALCCRDQIREAYRPDRAAHRSPARSPSRSRARSGARRHRRGRNALARRSLRCAGQDGRSVCRFRGRRPSHEQRSLCPPTARLPPTQKRPHPARLGELERRRHFGRVLSFAPTQTAVGPANPWDHATSSSSSNMASAI